MDREGKRETDRQADKKKGRETAKQKETASQTAEQADRTDRYTDRQTDRQTDRHTDRQTDTHSQQGRHVKPLPTARTVTSGVRLIGNWSAQRRTARRVRSGGLWNQRNAYTGLVTTDPKITDSSSRTAAMPRSI